MSIIPGGRGVRYGRDSNVEYRESIDERVGRLWKKDEWLLSNVASSSGSVSLTADRLYLYVCNYPEKVLTASEARLYVDANVAGSFSLAAIYNFRGRDSGFYKVPNSEVTIDCAAIGVRTASMSLGPQVNPEARYFIGLCASSAAISFIGTSLSGDCTASLYLSHSSAEALPANISMAEITKSTSCDVPRVVYLSRDAAEVM